MRACYPPLRNPRRRLPPGAFISVPRPPPRSWPFLGLFLALVSGCVVHVYEPLSGLHRPIVVDTSVANFQGVSLDIYCPSGEGLSRAEAADLCRKVGILFENQGAEIRTSSRDRRVQGKETDDGEESAAWAPDLILELRARDLQETSDPLSWLLCFGTFTLWPGVTEETFAQDVIVRDGSGFLLLSDTLRGRIVHRFGVGAWGGNKVLDIVWRDKEEELSGDIAQRELSADLYQQLSQILFNAAMRASVLSEGPAVRQAAP